MMPNRNELRSPEHPLRPTAFYRRTGRSGLKLPLISLGLWHNFGADDDFANARAMVFRAFDLGITHFDLANNYGPPPGSAETTFGRILAEDLRGLSRRDDRLHQGRLRHVAGPLRRVGLAQVPAREPRPEPEAPGPRVRGHLLQPPSRSRHSARGDDGRARPRRALGQGALRRDLQLRARGHHPGGRSLLREMGAPCLIHQPRYSMFDADAGAGPLRRARARRHRQHRLLAAGPGRAHEPLPGRHPEGRARRPRPALPEARADHQGQDRDGPEARPRSRRAAGSPSRRWRSPGCCASRS